MHRFWVIGSLLLLLTQASWAQSLNEVRMVGEMRQVMKQGRLEGQIWLDSLPDKHQLYGLGPVAYLAGEIMVLDGRSYRSTVLSDTSMRVEETFDLHAPFFGYARIAEWKEIALPDSVMGLAQLEAYLQSHTVDMPRPFFFRLSGQLQTATIHIVNLPAGSKVSSPEEAHRGLVKYPLRDEAVEVLGFFSTEHRAIFTHHDTFLHLHLITANRQQMGHVDALQFEPGSMRLLLPLD